MNEIASDGALGAGTAIETANYHITPTGGALVAGSVQPVVDLAVNGGAVVGSIATVAGHYRVATTGGVSGGSVGQISVFYRITPTGGIRTNGGSVIRIEFMASGGAVAAGVSINSLINFGRGGSSVGGESLFTIFYKNINGRGGTRAGGKAKVSRRTNLNPVKTGIGRTLASDNILKPKLPTSLLLQTFGLKTPAAPTTVRAQNQAQWNDITESNIDVLPPITIKIQRPYLPPKRRGMVARNRQFATITTT
jgi:hypothetical protein